MKLDRWNISAGKRLWPQIEGFICDPSESDAWILVATDQSLASEPCKEEFAYALDRALDGRGETFPIIALFLGSTDDSLVPAAIRTQLHVSITDPDWKERIVAAVEGRAPDVQTHKVAPYALRLHPSVDGAKPAVELRPRAGVWAPFFAAVPLQEKDALSPSINIGPRDTGPRSCMLQSYRECPDSKGDWWVMSAADEATPTRSYYLLCKSFPTKIAFGVKDGQPCYIVTLSPPQRDGVQADAPDDLP